MVVYNGIRGKRGWIKIAEAFLAIVIIAAVLPSAYSVTRQKNTLNVYKIEDSLLDGVVLDSNLRQKVLESNESAVSSFIRERMNPLLEFSIKICNPNDICNLPEYRKNVYARERIVSSTLDEYSPKKIKLFVWEK